MRDAICADLFTGAIKRLQALSDTKHFGVQRFAGTLASHPLKHSASIGNQRHTAQSPILRSRFGVAAHNDFASLKIDITPGNLLAPR